MALTLIDRRLCRLCVCVFRSGPVLALTSSSPGSRPGLPGPLVFLSPSLLPPFCDGLRLLAGKRSLPPENCQWQYRLLEVLLPYLFGALQRTVRACSAPPFLIISGGVLTPYKSLRLPRSSIFRFCRNIIASKTSRLTSRGTGKHSYGQRLLKVRYDPHTHVDPWYITAIFGYPFT